VLIFLAGVAFLLMPLAIGERAAMQPWHGGTNRYSTAAPAAMCVVQACRDRD
jgi:hypothetical protein